MGEWYNIGNDQLETNTAVQMEKMEFKVTRGDMLEADKWNLI